MKKPLKTLPPMTVATAGAARRRRGKIKYHDMETPEQKIDRRRLIAELDVLIQEMQDREKPRTGYRSKGADRVFEAHPVQGIRFRIIGPDSATQ